MTLQEAQRENAFLRAQFAERTDCVALEKAEAEHRLGAVEAETRRLTDSLKETCERHAEEMKKQEERVYDCPTFGVALNSLMIKTAQITQDLLAVLHFFCFC